MPSIQKFVHDYINEHGNMTMIYNDPEFKDYTDEMESHGKYERYQNRWNIITINFTLDDLCKFFSKYKDAKTIIDIERIIQNNYSLKDFDPDWDVTDYGRMNYESWARNNF